MTSDFAFVADLRIVCHHDCGIVVPDCATPPLDVAPVTVAIPAVAETGALETVGDALNSGSVEGSSEKRLISSVHVPIPGRAVPHRCVNY